MEEKSLRQCKACGDSKTRILEGTFPNNTKKWVDENLQLWNGRTCPDCNKKRLNGHYESKKTTSPITQTP